jgi:hypothetical protein
LDDFYSNSTSEELWVEALDRVEKKYDLENINIYVHGDGARLIKEAQEWLPKSRFVLDPYHKNKYITEVIAGFDANEEKMLRTAIQQALENEDTEYFYKSVQYVLGKRPEREETITDTETYF